MPSGNSANIRHAKSTEAKRHLRRRQVKGSKARKLKAIQDHAKATGDNVLLFKILDRRN